MKLNLKADKMFLQTKVYHPRVNSRIEGRVWLIGTLIYLLGNEYCIFTNDGFLIFETSRIHKWTASGVKFSTSLKDILPKRNLYDLI